MKSFWKGMSCTEETQGVITSGLISGAAIDYTTLKLQGIESVSQCFFFSVLFIVELLDNIFIHFCLSYLVSDHC